MLSAEHGSRCTVGTLWAHSGHYRSVVQGMQGQRHSCGLQDSEGMGVENNLYQGEEIKNGEGELGERSQ